MTRRAATLVALLLVGCGTTEPVAESGDGARLTTNTFIQVMIELARAAETAATPAAYEAEKRVILERHGTTADALIGFAERRGTDAELMAAVWDSIEEELKADTVGARVGPPGHAADSTAAARGDEPRGGGR